MLSKTSRGVKDFGKTSRDVKDFGTNSRGGKEIGTEIPDMGTGTELEQNEFQLQILERERNLVPFL